MVEELKSRGIKVVVYSTEDIFQKSNIFTKNDLIVGDFEWTRKALASLQVNMP